MSGVIALLIGFGLMQMGNTFQGTLLSIRGSMSVFSPVEIGAVGAAFWAGIVIGSLRGGTIIRRVGHIRTFAALGAVASTAPLIHLLVVNPLVWIAARALTGFCFAGLFIVVESWLNAAATAETRGRVLSIYSMTGLVAGIAGQLLLPSTDPAGFSGFCFIAVIIALSLVPITLTRTESPNDLENGQRIGLRELFARSPFGVVTAFLCGLTTSAFFTLGPNFAQGRGLDSMGIAAFMASGTLGGFIVAWPLGLLSDHLDRRIVILGAAVVAAASLFAMSVLVPQGASPLMLWICAALLGATIVPTYSIVLAHVNDVVPKGSFVAASSRLLLIQGVGAVVGPLMAGAAMSTWDRGLSFTLIATQLLIVLWGLYRITRSAKSKDKGIFLMEPSVPVGTTFAPAHLEGRATG